MIYGHSCCTIEIVFTRQSAINVNGTGDMGAEEDYPEVVVQKVVDEDGNSKNTGVIVFSPLAQKPDCATGKCEMVS